MKINFKTNQKSKDIQPIFYVDDVKTDKKTLELKKGTYKIRIEQFHPFNSKHIFYLWLFYMIAFIINGERELFRMNKYFAVVEFDMNVENDTTVFYAIHHKRKNMFYDTYWIEIENNKKYQNIVNTAEQNVYTKFGSSMVLFASVSSIAFVFFVIIKVIINRI